jgi:hypothetical protein
MVEHLPSKSDALSSKKKRIQQENFNKYMKEKEENKRFRNA